MFELFCNKLIPLIATLEIYFSVIFYFSSRLYISTDPLRYPILILLFLTSYIIDFTLYVPLYDKIFYK